MAHKYLHGAILGVGEILMERVVKCGRMKVNCWASGLLRVVWFGKRGRGAAVGARPRRDPPPPPNSATEPFSFFYYLKQAGLRGRAVLPDSVCEGDVLSGKGEGNCSLCRGPELQQEMPADLEELKRLPNNELELQNKPLSPRVGALRPLPPPLTLRQPRFETTPRISPQTVLVAAGPPAPTAPGDAPSELRQSHSHARGCRGAPKTSSSSS